MAKIKWPCDVKRSAVQMRNSGSSCGEGASARRDSKYLSRGVVDACGNTSATCSMTHMSCYNKGSCCYLLRLLLQANLFQGVTTAIMVDLRLPNNKPGKCLKLRFSIFSPDFAVKP